MVNLSIYTLKTNTSLFIFSYWLAEENKYTNSSEEPFGHEVMIYIYINCLKVHLRLDSFTSLWCHPAERYDDNWGTWSEITKNVKKHGWSFWYFSSSFPKKSASAWAVDRHFLYYLHFFSLKNDHILWRTRSFDDQSTVKVIKGPLYCEDCSWLVFCVTFEWLHWIFFSVSVCSITMEKALFLYFLLCCVWHTVPQKDTRVVLLLKIPLFKAQHQIIPILIYTLIFCSSLKCSIIYSRHIIISTVPEVFPDRAYLSPLFSPHCVWCVHRLKTVLKTFSKITAPELFSDLSSVTLATSQSGLLEKCISVTSQQKISHSEWWGCVLGIASCFHLFHASLFRLMSLHCVSAVWVLNGLHLC